MAKVPNVLRRIGLFDRRKLTRRKLQSPTIIEQKERRYIEPIWGAHKKDRRNGKGRRKKDK